MSMHADEDSDEVIVPRKRSNKEDFSLAETVEGRASPKGNGSQPAAVRTLSREAASIGLAAVRQAARQSRGVRFTALLHHITIDLLRQSYSALKHDAAPGIDGETWQSYGEKLEEKLKDLHERVHRSSYRSHPAKRSYIPKADGSRRPLSIWCLEDKIVQQAVVTVLGAIYEEDFVGFSYGFRSGRSQHDALDALHAGIYRRQVNWVLDADIQGFFDAMAHSWIIRFLEHRIADKRILRLVAKWLRAGIVEDGRVTRSERGAPQGAVISPILANVYLHYVYDLWVHRWRRTLTKTLEVGTFDKLLPPIFQRGWILLKATVDSGGFITSDHPVCLTTVGPRPLGVFKRNPTSPQTFGVPRFNAELGLPSIRHASDFMHRHPGFDRCRESYPRRSELHQNYCSRGGDEQSAVPAGVGTMQTFGAAIPLSDIPCRKRRARKTTPYPRLPSQQKH